MAVYRVDPIRDARWRQLLERHPEATVFHTPEWLQCLHQTYGYRSLVLTTTPPEQPLRDGVVLTAVRSWITGSRWVSVPFADHCQPLLHRDESLVELEQAVLALSGSEQWKFVELRPSGSLVPPPRAGWTPSASYGWHTLDLRPSIEELYRGLDKTSVRQPIRRAAREGVQVECGCDTEALHAFYRLLVATRRRHGVPPQPFAWFASMIGLFGDAAQVWVARHQQRPIAALLMLRFKHILVYKYSCSETRWNPLGGTPALLWQALQAGKANGATLLDLGRTDLTNRGLQRFKAHWGAQSDTLTYYRSAPGAARLREVRHAPRGVHTLVSSLPEFCLVAAGRFLYRHVA